jgi:hypothetical protein
MVALFAGACGPSGPSPTASYLTIAMRTAPNTVDPRQGGDEASQRVAQLIFSPLMQFGDALSWRAYPFSPSSSVRASVRYGELGCCSTIWFSAFRASSVLPFATYARASSNRIASTGKVESFCSASDL